MYFLISVVSFNLVFMPLTMTSVIPQIPNCDKPLGIEDRRIADSQFLSTDAACAKNSYKARLNGQAGYCSNIVSRKPLCLSIDLLDDFAITGLALQGHAIHTYSNDLMLWYYEKEFISYEGKKIKLQPKKGNIIEYVPLRPFVTSKLKIKLPFLQGYINCIRMEIYGCKLSTLASKEYNGCPSLQPLLQNHHLNMKFTQTNFDKQAVSFTAEYLLLSRPYAWCLSKRSTRLPEYNDWATIDMSSEYLVYAIVAKGYKDKPEDPEDGWLIAKSIKFQYSLDGTTKSNIHRRNEIDTLKGKLNLRLDIPILTRYVYVSMLLDESGTLGCIKIELYGCKATIMDRYTTNAPSTSTARVSTRVSTTNAPYNTAGISSYSIYEGDRYSEESLWIDSHYNGRKNDNGVLQDGIGCLTEKVNPDKSDPLSHPTCWVGWKKNETREPFILVNLHRLAVLSGVRLLTYANRTIDALPIKQMRVLAGSSTNLTEIGYICPPSTFYDSEKSLLEFDISLNGIKLQYLKLELEYSGEWILVRYIEIIRKDALPVNHLLKLSKTINECIAKKSPSTQEKNDDNIWKIPVIVVVVIFVIAVFIVFVIYHHKWSTEREKKRKDEAALVELEKKSVSV